MWIFITVGVFLIGVLVGARGVWAYMEYQWKTNPYQLKTIVDGVIERRKRKMIEEYREDLDYLKDK